MEKHLCKTCKKKAKYYCCLALGAIYFCQRCQISHWVAEHKYSCERKNS